MANNNGPLADVGYIGVAGASRKSSVARGRPFLRVGGALLALMLVPAVLAEPVNGRNLPLRLPQYKGMPLYETSADVLVQAPDKIDRLAPVPIRIKVLQQKVEWLSLLSDSPETAPGAGPQNRLLARFSLEPGTLPELSLRVFDSRLDGVLAVATTASRYLVARWGFQRDSAAPAPAPAPAPSVKAVVTAPAALVSTPELTVPDSAASAAVAPSTMPVEEKVSVAGAMAAVATPVQAVQPLPLSVSPTQMASGAQPAADVKRPKPEPQAVAQSTVQPDVQPVSQPAPQSVTAPAAQSQEGAELLSDTQIEQPAEIVLPELQMTAQRQADRTLVRLNSGSLLKHLGESTLLLEGQPWISEMQLLHGERPVLSAELSAAVWYRPFFQFAFSGGEVGDSLVLRWRRSDGLEGELVALITEY